MAKKEAKEETEDKPEKSGGGVVGFAIVGVAAIASSFGATYLLGGSNEAASPAIADCDTMIAAAAEAANKIPDYSDQIHVAIPEILITIGSSPAERYLKMNVSVATDKEGSKMIKDSEPVLVDAFINYLRSIELSDFEDPRYFSIIRDQLSHRSELVLGAAHSHGVLITEFLLR